MATSGFCVSTLFLKLVLFLSELRGYTRLIKEKEVCSMSLIEANEKIAEKVVRTHKAIESAVVNGYKATEVAAVSGFNKVSDAFIGKFFTKENETVEEAKALADAYFGGTDPYVLGYNNDVLVFAINEDDDFDMDDLFYVIVE